MVPKIKKHDVLEHMYNYKIGEVIEEIRFDGGFIYYIIVRDDETYGDHIELRQIKVDEDRRREGIGSKLLAELYKRAKEAGIKVIYTRSTATEEQVFGKFLKVKGFKHHEPSLAIKGYEYYKNV